MALETNDIMALRSLEGMTPYEQVKISNMQSRNRTSGVGIAGLVTGVAGVVAAIGVGLWSTAKASQAREAARTAQEVATAKNDGLRDLVQTIAGSLATERSERIEGDKNLSITISDTVSGSQQGTLSAVQQAELSAIANATNTVTAGLMTGQYSKNPIEVVRVSGRRECGCDDCGCNG